jgi:co-chaperonin GroES (HSP10)
MNHSVDPAKILMDELGNLDDIQVFNNEVMVAIYVRPEKTNSGIILPGATRDEDRYQGKVGLVVKMGLQAFDDPNNNWFKGTKVKVGDWVYFRVTDGWSINVHGVSCRMIDDTDVRGMTKYPDAVW